MRLSDENLITGQTILNKTMLHRQLAKQCHNKAMSDAGSAAAGSRFNWQRERCR